MKRFDKCMSCLSVELTRRCNMNCAVCGRGTPQNVNITKEIIDKTFDELEDVYIDNIRIHGGEPFLVPEIMEYLISQIIERHIYVNNVVVFTNGTQIKPELVEPFKNLIKYLNKVESEIKHIIRWYDSNSIKLYFGTTHTKFDIIVSEYEHNSDSETVNKFIEFYRQIDDADMGVIGQRKTFDSFGNITLEGNALKNYKQFIKDSVSLNDIRIVNNDYYFVSKCVVDENYGAKIPIILDGLVVKKTLTVSANGNVFPGCIMSYDRVDASPMFNILNCESDFFDKVVSFCWQHPTNQTARNFRNKFSAIEFCNNHNIKVQTMSQKDYELTKLLNIFAQRQESMARDMHSILPYLWLDEIDAISTTTLVLNMFDKDVPLDIIKQYLVFCSEFDSDTIDNITPEWCRGFILFLSETDRERKEKLKDCK